jgi:hypothetical protein
MTYATPMIYEVPLKVWVYFGVQYHLFFYSSEISVILNTKILKMF